MCMQWTEDGEICRKNIQVCDSRNKSQDNWLLTQYISYPSSVGNEIFVRITYDFSKCRDDPSCGITYFNVLQYHANSPSPQDQVETSNYNLIKQVEQPSLVNRAIATVSFQRPSINGLYIAVQDLGSCGLISQIQVYYEQCPSKVVGLVIYPTLPLPGRNSVTATEASAVCAPNARNISRLEFKAFGDGECERTVMCECLPGYMEEQVLVSDTNLSVSACQGEHFLRSLVCFR